MLDFLNIKTRKIKRQLKQKEQLLEIKQLEYATKVIDGVLEARNDIYDKDVSGGMWSLVGDNGNGSLSEQDHKDMLAGANKLYYLNPHARAVVRGLVKFTLGKGPLVTFDSDNARAKEIWTAFKKDNHLSRKEKEACTRLFRDGEFFLRKFVDPTNGDTTIRFIRPSSIANPSDVNLPSHVTHGIETNPDDIEDIRYYYQVDSEGKLKRKIPAEEIIHEKIFSDSDQKRGVSILGVCANRIKQYDEWLEDRIALNKVRSAIALIRTVDSSPGKIKSIRDENLSDNLDAMKKKQKAFQRATVITSSKNIEYKMLSPNINAADVRDDGRSMLLSVAAGVGMPEMIFTADYANANYSSSLIAQNPFVREIEEWQDFFHDFYEKLVNDVLQAKIDYGDLPEGTDKDCHIEFPPMMRDDIEKLAKAYETLFKYKVVSKRTWRGKMGLDDEAEKLNIEQEEDDVGLYDLAKPGQPGGGNPLFNTPLAPINQYGHLQEYLVQLKKAVDEGDYEEIEKIEGLISEYEQEYKGVDSNFSPPVPAIIEMKEKKKKEDENRNFWGELFGNFIEAVKDLAKAKSDINVNVESPQITVEKQIPEITVNTPDIKLKPQITVEKQTPDINISPPEITVNTPDIKLKPRIVVEKQTPDIQLNPQITVEKQTPDIQLTPQITVERQIPEINIQNIMEKEKPVKIAKSVQRDSTGKVIRIVEEEVF